MCQVLEVSGEKMQKLVDLIIKAISSHPQQLKDKVGPLPGRQGGRNNRIVA
jgi:hypothetical protein